MLALRKQDKSAPACLVNILPCKVHHNGQVNASQRHWDPQSSEDGKEMAYFRGRKLIGRALNIPEGYKGVVVEKTDRCLLQPPSSSMADADEEEEEADVEAPEVKIVKESASFDKITVWDHEAQPLDDSPHIKGVQEWMAFAQSMHSYDDEA
ncbi:hypothetical protein AAFC00_006939 [Neodothiora populina]|uniref:Uncharacterized protein n=1 Tax=Neodothiora populina TaxID=2781224 RepID=A0ABR3PBT5_9PEZI